VAVYVVCLQANVVRRIDASGIVTTVAGVYGVSGYNNDSILAVNATLSGPSGVTLYKGSLYITDTFNRRIRRVVLSTGVIQTVAGSGIVGVPEDGTPATQASLLQPQANVVFDSFGNMLIADVRQVRRVDANTNLMTTVVNAPGIEGEGVEYVNILLWLNKHHFSLALPDADNYQAQPGYLVLNSPATVLGRLPFLWARRLFRHQHRGGGVQESSGPHVKKVKQAPDTHPPTHPKTGVVRPQVPRYEYVCIH
jgi:hypothetical protein